MRPSTLRLTLPLALPLAVTAASKTHRSGRPLTLLMTATTAPAAAGVMSAAIVGRLTDRELRHRTRGHRLALGARQRGSNERATHRPFFWRRRGPIGQGRRR